MELPDSPRHGDYGHCCSEFCALWAERTKVVNLWALVGVDWKKDPQYVYIGRPSIWGNPYKIGRDGSRADVIEKFRSWVRANTKAGLRAKAKHELRGKLLVCYCAPAPCHGDIWAFIADGGVL